MQSDFLGAVCQLPLSLAGYLGRVTYLDVLFHKIANVSTHFMLYKREDLYSPVAAIVYGAVNVSYDYHGQERVP